MGKYGEEGGDEKKVTALYRQEWGICVGLEKSWNTLVQPKLNSNSQPSFHVPAQCQKRGVMEIKYTKIVHILDVVIDAQPQTKLVHILENTLK